MTFLFYISILAVALTLYLVFRIPGKKGRKESGLQNYLFRVVLICAIVLLGKFIRGYFFFDQEQYGKNYNHERLRMGIDTIPADFQMVKGPIETWQDYFERHPIYQIVYQSKGRAAGHFKKEVDIGDSGPGREFDFYIREKDTVVTSYIYENTAK